MKESIDEEFEHLTEFFANKIREKDDTIYRLKCIVEALCIIIAMLILLN
jgi:hypothetical protein